MLSRTIVISDIHCYYYTFVSLLEQIEYVPDVDRLILLGDYVDGGKFSRQVIDLVRQLVESHGAKVIGGNHDDMF
jgi:serine/threonine protein phosphatase 1